MYLLHGVMHCCSWIQVAELNDGKGEHLTYIVMQVTCNIIECLFGYFYLCFHQLCFMSRFHLQNFIAMFEAAISSYQEKIDHQDGEEHKHKGADGDKGYDV